MEERIARHRTALSRGNLSRPIRLALEEGLLTRDDSFFDYGCGQGDDLRLLAQQGFRCSGWDPVFLSDATAEPANVVNLGYVVNVIENQKERELALSRAWSLARKILVVAARTYAEMKDLAFAEPFSDGLLTSRRTFQKFYEQAELKNWIDDVLGVSSVAASPGIFFVFRNDSARESYLASRYRRTSAVPRLRLSDQLFSKHEETLQPLMRFVAQRGRLPQADELPQSAAIQELLGSIKRAFQVIRYVTGSERWDAIAADRKEDLELYLALAKFNRRARWSELPDHLRYDVRAFFGNYTAACSSADQLLLNIGKEGEVDRACVHSPVGKLTPTALYVHRSAVEGLSHLLRAFEGCGRGYLGDIEGANVIKLYRSEPKISYLSYPNFEADPHPRLDFSLTVNLREFTLKKRRYSGQPNPPVLHRKETFVAPDHPLHEKFSRLTRQEETHGLLDQTDVIGLLRGWENILSQKGLQLRGHRLVKVKSGAA